MTLEERAAKIRLVVMDVDGTLTDSSMYYSVEGEVMKRFSTRDGMGVTLLKRSGIDCAIITSEMSLIAQRRGEKLGIANIILGSHDKSASLMELSEKLSIPLEAIAYIGDDVNDGPVMRLCGLSGCPSDAADAIKEIAHHTCRSSGGNGAVREFAELILKAQHLPVILPERW
jgi:3-deoxy-D-manno-octulosonate 8-phosphate phosphatase (KDO 8-P phosphatase)